MGAKLHTRSSRRTTTFRMTENAIEPPRADVISYSRPIEDPMGLYSMDTEERRSGKIKSIEDDAVKLENDIYDPLNIYPDTSEEKLNGRIKPLEAELKVTKAVVDPLTMYSNDDALDKDALMSVVSICNVSCPFNG